MEREFIEDKTGGTWRHWVWAEEVQTRGHSAVYLSYRPSYGGGNTKFLEEILKNITTPKISLNHYLVSFCFK